MSDCAETKCNIFHMLSVECFLFGTSGYPQTLEDCVLVLGTSIWIPLTYNTQ